MARITIDPQQLTRLPMTQEMTVDRDHLDIMGHMNVQFYAAVFARAARQMTSLVGITADYVDREQRGAFMLKNFTQYISEARLGDTLVVYTRVVARSEKRYQYMHFMLNTTNGQIAATMEVLTTHADLVARRSVPFPPDVAANIDNYIAAHNQIDWSEAPLCGILSP